MVNIGITGTRLGLTEKAKEQMLLYLQQNNHKINKIHHGDCVGVDKEIHEIIENKYNYINIYIHPPSNNKFRAYCQSNFIKKEYGYIKRNHNIVNESDILIAFPPTQKEILRSGTWSTIRYAIENNKSTYIIYPNGEIQKYNI